MPAPRLGGRHTRVADSQWWSDADRAGLASTIGHAGRLDHQQGSN